jgi:hypothetical protein
MITWVLATVVIVTALTWGVLTVRSGFSAVVPTQTFASGDGIVIDLDPADAPAVYVGTAAPGSIGFEVSYPFSSPVGAECEISGNSEGVALVPPGRNVVLIVDEVEWSQLFLIRAPQPGTYELRCTGDNVRFGVAKDLPAGLVTYVAWLFIGVLAAAAAAVGTTIVLVRERGAARRRLLASTWPAPPGPDAAGPRGRANAGSDLPI